jgi:GDP-4-dehydro-6-deoxy-D-mannose reductase
MQKVLITGVNGFVGHHVATQLNRRGISVVGVGNQSAIDNDLGDVVASYISCDLTNPEMVSKIDLTGVDAIINLAGFAKVGDSAGQGELYNRVNIGVHTVLYDECLKQNVSPRIIAVSTGAVYDPEQPMPITEESRLIDQNRTNEYVVSKQLMEDAMTLYRQKGLQIIVARPFNHSGPGQLPGFLIPDLGEQIVVASAGNASLKVGNLNTKRDYTDVRDVARAYVELAVCNESELGHDLYNICSGKSIAGHEILSMLLNSFGATGLNVEVDAARVRTHDIPDIYGSRDRLTQDIGWSPQTTVEKMIDDYVSWKRSNT